MNRPNKLDWLIYSFFRWWWNPIFKKDELLTKMFILLMKEWTEQYFGDSKNGK